MRVLVLVVVLAMQVPAALSQTAPLAALESPDVASGVEFGYAVAVDGAVAAVGGPGAQQQAGLTPGAVTLFERGTDGVWRQGERLVPSGFGAGRFEERERFGAALALEGDRLVIGAPGEDEGATPEAGAVYIVERQSDGTWAETVVLRDPQPVTSGGFGSAVALSGSRVMITASGDRPDGAAAVYRGGTVYVFERDVGGAWGLADTLQRPSGEGNVAFGHSLALEGTRALIGAGGSSASAVNPDGRAYIYEQNGTAWNEVATFESPDPRVADTNKQFGEAVALEGDLALVSAWGQGIQVGGIGAFASGVAYLFEKVETGAWRLRQRLVPDDLDREALGTSRQIQFGYSVGLDDGRAVVSARRDAVDVEEDAGSVYVFADTDGRWRQHTKLKGSGMEFTEFGASTALSGRTVVTGEIFGGDPSRQPGVAYVHTTEPINPPPPPGPSPPPPVLLAVQETVGVRDGTGLRESAQMLVQEAIGVGDGLGLRESAQVLVRETVGIEDGLGLRESAQLLVQEAVGVGDDLGLRESAQLRLQETVGVRDDSGLRESLQLFLEETVGVRDATGLRESLQMLVQESIAVRDAADLRESLRLFVQETIAVRDEAQLRESLRLFLQETVGVADTSGLRTSLELLVRESIRVQDDPGLAAALALLIQEQIRISDGMSLMPPDGSEASGAVPVFVDTERVMFLGPVGMGLMFSGVSARGGVSVFFEEAPPEAPDGIPEGATLAPYRWVIQDARGLAFDSARVEFDLRALSRLDITDSEAITVYVRPASGAGAFVPLRTTVDAETGEIVGNGLEAFGEVALAGTGFTVGAEDDGPVVFGISPPAPNPARDLTRVVLSVPEPGAAQVDVLDLRGRRIATLVQGELPAGRTALQIRASAFASGNYILVFRSGDQFAISRLTVVR